MEFVKQSHIALSKKNIHPWRKNRAKIQGGNKKRYIHCAAYEGDQFASSPICKGDVNEVGGKHQNACDDANKLKVPKGLANDASRERHFQKLRVETRRRLLEDMRDSGCDQGPDRNHAAKPQGVHQRVDR